MENVIKKALFASVVADVIANLNMYATIVVCLGLIIKQNAQAYSADQPKECKNHVPVKNARRMLVMILVIKVVIVAINVITKNITGR